MEEDLVDDDERREAAIASIPSLQPNFNPSGITQSQLSKFQELHKRRLQIKARSKIQNKAKGKSDKTSKSRAIDPNAKGFTDEISSKESTVPISKGNIIKDTSSPQQKNTTVHVGAMKRQKLHWGLDTKERWERKANM